MLRSLMACGSAAAFLLGVNATTALAQAGRVVDCKVAVNDDALVVTKVMVGGTEVQCYWSPGASKKYEPPPAFQAGDDWLTDLTISLFNRTNKTIVYALVSLSFPQTQPERADNISLGRIPDIAALDRQGKPIQQGGQQPLSLGPGQTLVLKVSDHMNEIRGLLGSALSVPVTRVTVLLNRCYFEDGMHWNQGSYSVPDQDHPGQWKVMAPRSYFPGDRNANMPPAATGARR